MTPIELKPTDGPSPRGVLRVYRDEEYGDTIVRADPVWPWFLAGFFMLAAIALLFAGALYFAGLAHNAPSLTPVIEDHK